MSGDPAAGAPALGVGVIYNPALETFVRAPGAIDYLAITPEMFWSDAGADRRHRFVDLERWVAVLEWAQPRMPIVAHHIGMSIASAVASDAAHLDQLVAWSGRWSYPWFSDHLAFIDVGDHAGGAAGLALPAPFDEEVLDLVVGRARDVMTRTGLPFLIENSARYVDYPEQEMGEAAFLNAFAARSGGGILLDLHNLYVNARNLGFDAFYFIDALDLGAVIEAHVAGGTMIGPLYADSHAGAVPEPVWALLDHLVPRAPNLRGIAFEFHESYFEQMGEQGVHAQIERARRSWALRP